MAIGQIVSQAASVFLSPGMPDNCNGTPSLDVGMLWSRFIVDSANKVRAVEQQLIDRSNSVCETVRVPAWAVMLGLINIIGNVRLVLIQLAMGRYQSGHP